jgi:hypothetical protein
LATHLGYAILGNRNGQQDASSRRWNFSINLVGGDLEQWFIKSNGVADSLEPASHSAFGHAFA